MSKIIDSKVGRFRMVRDGDKKLFLWECPAPDRNAVIEEIVATASPADFTAEGMRAHILAAVRALKSPGAEIEVVELRAALRNMADAYERKVRTNLTPEEIAKEPWRCTEYIEAERLCKMPLRFTNEWLREKIKNDPDIDCEAGPPLTRPSANADAGGALSAKQQLRKKIAMALFAKRHEPISAIGIEEAFQFYERKFANEGCGAARITAAGQFVELADAVMSFVAPAPQPPDGWVVVPREPTPNMRIKGGIAYANALPNAGSFVDCADACFKAMLGAAPKPQVPGGE